MFYEVGRERDGATPTPRYAVRCVCGVEVNGSVVFVLQNEV
jgi:hypothetical protein